MSGDVRVRHKTRNDGSFKAADFDHPLPVYATELPNGATPFFLCDTAAAGAITLTQALAAGTPAYVQGWGIDGKGATASTEINVTIAALLGGTLTIPYRVVVGATANALKMDVILPWAWPTINDGTDLVMTVPSFGAGNTDAMAWIYGYLLQD